MGAGTWRRVLAEKRRWLVPLAVLAAANLVVYAVGVAPMRARLAGADARSVEVGLQVRNAVTAQEQARRMVDAAERAARDLQRFYADILPADQAAARRLAYLRVAQLADRTNLTVDRRTTDEQQDKESSLRRLETKMQVRGGYREIRQFIYELERAPEFLVITDLALSQEHQSDTGLDLTLQLATFYRAANE